MYKTNDQEKLQKVLRPRVNQGYKNATNGKKSYKDNKIIKQFDLVISNLF